MWYARVMGVGVSRLASLSALLWVVGLASGCGECRVDADCPSDAALQRCNVESRRCEALAPRTADSCASDTDCAGGRRCLAQECHFAPSCLTFGAGADLVVVAYCRAAEEASPTQVTATGVLSSDGCAVELALEGDGLGGQTVQLAALAPGEASRLPVRTELASGDGSCAGGVYVPGPGALLLEGCVFEEGAGDADGGTAATTTCQLAALREFSSSSRQAEIPCLPGLLECATAGAVCTPALDDEGIEIATAGVRLGVCR